MSEKYKSSEYTEINFLKKDNEKFIMRANAIPFFVQTEDNRIYLISNTQDRLGYVFTVFESRFEETIGCSYSTNGFRPFTWLEKIINSRGWKVLDTTIAIKPQ